ncbi:hypothetical protein MRX96_016831 [Rhipicephalus microplus]
MGKLEALETSTTPVRADDCRISLQFCQPGRCERQNASGLGSTFFGRTLMHFCFFVQIALLRADAAVGFADIASPQDSTIAHAQGQGLDGTSSWEATPQETTRVRGLRTTSGTPAGTQTHRGVTDAARTSGVRQRRADSGNKESPEAAPGSGGLPARSLASVVNHSSPRTPAKVPAKDQRRRQVIVVGDSNMARVGEVIKGRVGDDERVKVSKLPGKRVGEVMQQAKEQLRDRMEDRSLVVVMGGVNDVLQGRGGGFAKQIAKGITELRTTSEDEHLQDILGVARGHGYRIRPGAARRVAGCNRLRSARLRCRLRRAGIAGSVKRRFATVVRDSACASEDSADGAATTGVREPSGRQALSRAWRWLPRLLKSPTKRLSPLTSLHTEQRNPPQATASCTGPAVGAGAATAAARARRGRRQTADRHLEFFEKRLALEAEMRERQPSRKDA